MTDVKALRALINAATPSRPWETYPLTRAGQGYGIGYATEHGHKEGVCEDRFLTAADATLIAAAVNALPELLDEVERLRVNVSAAERRAEEAEAQAAAMRKFVESMRETPRPPPPPPMPRRRA